MSAARTIRFTLNGARVTADVMPHETLVDMLTQRFELRGARESCGQGLCGCCTVLVNGTAVSGCLYLATLAEGAEVATVEGGEVDAVQEAFVERSAAQCGFCTPGFVMSITALLRDNPTPTDEEIREGLSGNFCRCTGYQSIVNAVHRAVEMQA